MNLVGRRQFHRAGLALVLLALVLSLAAPLHAHAEQTLHGVPCLFCTLAATPALAAAPAPDVAPVAPSTTAPAAVLVEPEPTSRPAPTGRAPPASIIP